MLALRMELGGKDLPAMALQQHNRRKQARRAVHILERILRLNLNLDGVGLRFL